MAFLQLAAVAMRLLHLSPADISPNLWYLAPNPASKAFSTAYPYLMGLMFLASFPFTILARTISTSAVALLCCPSRDAGEGIPLLSATGDLQPRCLVKGGRGQGGGETQPPTAPANLSHPFQIAVQMCLHTCCLMLHICCIFAAYRLHICCSSGVAQGVMLFAPLSSV